MRLQNEDREEPEINLTSLIDVVFLLLIFFMVSTTFDQQALLRLELPEASTSEAESVPEVIEVTVSEDGRIFVDDQLLTDNTRAALQAVLNERREAAPEAPLVVRADGRASHGLVVLVLDAAAAEGIGRVGIATMEADPAGDER
ncbi:ExbD/TolR family protein [Wenzhouxiangella limi]|uniref:Biopolymer transporter ExbD n=1 Tax=Wenzhouxiangella limi TaxID=2707351 RepID=A0A845UXR1_9GAMM|nr:biopolymer transporter ExbD [Wenzhouxiangella limi]NDY94650.1 biopolymer transporter ExbD [Wenzhouxiangella limi]